MTSAENCAKYGHHSLILHMDSSILQHAPACVLLMTIGSIPFWILLSLISMPPPLLKSQIINTGIVAISSGIIATSISYKARKSTKSPYEISAVDATQSGEVISSLVGRILLLHGALPELTGSIGIVIIVVGIVGYSMRPI